MRAEIEGPMSEIGPSIELSDRGNEMSSYELLILLAANEWTVTLAFMAPLAFLIYLAAK